MTPDIIGQHARLEQRVATAQQHAAAGDGRLATTGGSVLLMLLLGSVALAAGLRLRARVGSLSA